MKADHLNAIIQGTQSIILRVCGETVTLGKLFAKSHPFSMKEVSVSIELIGELHGYVVYTMDMSAAFYLASRLLPGMSLSTFDEMAQSAICELSNMISGAAATNIYQLKTVIDISTPTYYYKATSKELTFFQGVRVVCMPLMLRDGSEFEIDVFIE